MATTEGLTGELISSFAMGMNNVAQPDALPDGFVRDACNLDPTVGGGLAMRAGYALVSPVSNVRGGVAMDDRLVIVSDRILLFFPADGSIVDIGAAPAGSAVIGASLNGDCFLQVGTTQLRVRGITLAPWAPPNPGVSVTVGAGALPAGTYRVATTTIDVFDAESGTTPSIVTVPDGSSLALTWGDGTARRVYAGSTDGETLYFQSTAVGTFTMSGLPADSGERLTTANLQPPPIATLVACDKARILLAAGNVVWATEPFAPHLVNYVDGYVAVDADVTMVQAVDDGVFVATAHKTFFLTGLGTDSTSIRTVANVGAVRGSQVLLPDGTATWMTPYGQARTSTAGGLEFPQRTVYAPTIATSATAGVVRNNGVESVVTNQTGAAVNSLGVADSFDLEIT